jgi:hypothetical protein
MGGAARPVRTGLLPGDQAAVSPKNGAGRDQPVTPYGAKTRSVF